jgi:peptide chain release factor 2
VQASSAEFLREASAALQQLERSVAAWELQRLLSGRLDAGPAVLSIYAGAGGDDAMDWAEMLERMYTRWFADRGWSAQLRRATAFASSACHLGVFGDLGI